MEDMLELSLRDLPDSTLHTILCDMFHIIVPGLPVPITDDYRKTIMDTVESTRSNDNIHRYFIENTGSSEDTPYDRILTYIENLARAS